MKSNLRKMPVYAPITDNEPMEAIGHRIQSFTSTRANHPALITEQGTVGWRAFLERTNQIANRLREAGLQTGDSVAALSENSADYIALYLGVLTAGGCMVPLSGMASAESLGLMLSDCSAQFLFVSQTNRDLLHGVPPELKALSADRIIALDENGDGIGEPLTSWLGNTSTEAAPADVTINDAFNIIYSSGTTGTPKGILHDYRFRQRQMVRMSRFGLDADAVNLVSTPLYSNTTLVSVLPTLFHGGTLVIMAKFDARRFLELAEAHQVTHAMLVPVQYQRILADTEFDRFDLSSFKLKLCTSAPLRPEVIADAMARWPGNIRELYGLTEGGISTSLDCAAYPDKWNSVGVPTEGAEVRVINEEGHELPKGEIGELVGRAISMMRGYVNRPEQTEEIVWESPEGDVFYRSGDMGRIDKDGFIHILDRRKDMIISGGFNIYAVDLEKALLAHPAVDDAAVIGVPSDQWGETPLGLVVLKPGLKDSGPEILEWANEKLGRSQRISAIEFRTELPRSTIGKILKRELREPYWQDTAR
ncbi:class I adenylate-forming enzyme family protein [Marinobacter sp. S6332]|uniref:class I adenylate-forming enzyme family protein n=1 Tax=Marinobacter sp. S6332 TaxID=2926403 RepID=UPI001FF48799|nr:class I adenylate-forming enzyme family protein [Marinobacter sp. S6332]MCK0162383.1 acyl--CoA ligase [Marinobacter sp. S6332]